MDKILNDIKYRFKNASIIEKLIYINLSVFVFVYIFNTFGFLFQIEKNTLIKWFALPASFDDLVFKPWTILTYGFLHVGFIHLLSNLILLYFIGNLFIEYFSAKTALTFYLLGTLFGGVLFSLSYNFFPVFTKHINNSIHLRHELTPSPSLS